LRITLRSRSSVGCWNTTPIRASAARGFCDRSCPATEIWPERVVKSRVSKENSVDFPAPLGPSSAANRPGATSKLTVSSALRLP